MINIRIINIKKSLKYYILFTLFYVNILSAHNLASYLKKFAPIAVYEMEKFGIPASIKLSQSILESCYGNSRLSKESNNHFGIKCGKYWTGDTCSYDDDEKGECFRKYINSWHSFRDHSNFLKKSRYSQLFSLCIYDYKSWAHVLKQAGYATAKDYAERIIYNIEKYQLWRFDHITYQDLSNHFNKK